MRQHRTPTAERNLWFLALLVTLLMTLVAGRPQDVDDDEDSDRGPDKRDDVARVQIKVYRGPTKNDGYAPWGFWVKQPSDDQ